jgi:hypothetical protein
MAGVEIGSVQEQEHLAGIRSLGGKPVGRHRAGGHICHQHVAGHGMKAVTGDEGGTALFQARRRLGGTGLPPIPQGFDRVLHCLAWHASISSGALAWLPV